MYLLVFIQDMHLFSKIHSNDGNIWLVMNCWIDRSPKEIMRWIGKNREMTEYDMVSWKSAIKVLLCERRVGRAKAFKS